MEEERRIHLPTVAVFNVNVGRGHVRGLTPVEPQVNVKQLIWVHCESIIILPFNTFYFIIVSHIHEHTVSVVTFHHGDRTDTPNTLYFHPCRCDRSLLHMFYSYIIHVLNNVRVPGDVSVRTLLRTHMHLHRFTPTERQRESSTPLWRF